MPYNNSNTQKIDMMATTVCLFNRAPAGHRIVVWLLSMSVLVGCKFEANVEPGRSRSADGATENHLAHHPAPEGTPPHLPSDSADLTGPIGVPDLDLPASVVKSPTSDGSPEEAAADLYETDRSDEGFLRAFRLVFCAQKRGDQEEVFRVWEKFGYTSANWAMAVQAAQTRTQSGDEAFRHRWAEVRRVPCP